ncbi:unnamed protein product [Urochloa humidicola]
MMVVKGDVYYSNSDSDDDDDVDRYVFLARQPTTAPAAGRLAEEDRGAGLENEDDDDDGDATADEEESERGGGRRKKRPLGRREILDAALPPPPPTKKNKKKAAGVELIAPRLPQMTASSGSGSETESDSAASPCGVRAGESGSEGSRGTKVHEHHRLAPGRGGEAKKKKRGACGKRGKGPGCEEDGDRAVTAAVAAKAGAPPAAAATSGRFLCNLCERCFDSFQALGGHVLGHRKKAKIAIATAASCLDVDDGGGGAGDCEEEETAEVEANEEKTASSIALQLHKMAAAAARHGKANGRGGGRNGKIKAADDVAEHREDADSGGHDDDANGDTTSFRKKGNAMAAPGKDFTNGGNSRRNGKTGIGAGIPNKKMIVGTSHEGDNNGGANVSRTAYKCKVCGMECPTGPALGGHMRKHRKPPTLVGGGDGEGRSSASPPTDDNCQIPLARMFGAETGFQRENKIGWV